jgi:hypothetical protein
LGINGLKGIGINHQCKGRRIRMKTEGEMEREEREDSQMNY